MRPPKRSLTLVIAVLSALSVVASGEGPGVVVDPEWLNYGQTATLTASFDPPCREVSIFKRGMDAGYPDQCIYGSECRVDYARPRSIAVSANPAGSWVRFTGVNAMANGYYYAKCPETGETYEAEVAIGVKPRIIAVEFGSPTYGVQINLTRWQAGRRVDWNSPLDDPYAQTFFKTNHPIPLAEGDAYITFILGMGVDPKVEAPQATSPKIFTFEAPGFDDFGEAMPREDLEDYLPFEDYPMATRVRFKLSRDFMVRHKKCSLRSLALATLNQQRDLAVVELEFKFEPTISDVVLKQIGIGEEVPVGRDCECLFTCHVWSCPTRPVPLYDFEWTFPEPDDVSSRFDESHSNADLMQQQSWQRMQVDISLRKNWAAGNVVGFPPMFRMNATACQELFLASRELMRTQQEVTIACRVAGGRVPANRHELPAFSFMDESFRDECKAFRLPSSTGDARFD